MNVNKININQSEQSYYIASDIYDVTANNNGVTFESLSALLSSENLSTLIPSEVRCGGMSIHFVQSSDNKYVQYRLMKQTFSTNEDDWQGVDDEPTSDSENLVKSGGIANKLLNNFFVGQGQNYSATRIDGIAPGTKIRVFTFAQTWECNDRYGYIFYIESYNGTSYTVLGGTQIPQGSPFPKIRPYYDVTIPDDSQYIRVGGRAEAGVKVKFIIALSTTFKSGEYPIDISLDKIISQSDTNLPTSKAVGKQLLNNYFICNGDNNFSGIDIQAAPGNTYRVFMCEDWDTSIYTDTYIKLSMGYYNQDSEYIQVFGKFIKEWSLPDYVDVTIPSDAKPLIRIQGRGNANEIVKFMIFNISVASKEDIFQRTSMYDTLLVKGITPSLVVGSITTSYASNIYDCLCDFNYYKVTPNAKVYIIRASDISVRIIEYDENKAYIRYSQYTKISTFIVGSTTRFIRISADYTERGFSSSNHITLNDFHEGDFGLYYKCIDTDDVLVADKYPTINSPRILSSGAVRKNFDAIVDGQEGNYYVNKAFNINGELFTKSCWGAFKEDIPCTSGTKVVVWNCGRTASNSAYLVFLNSNKEKIADYAYTANDLSRTLDAPDNTAYLRCCFALTKSDDSFNQTPLYIRGVEYQRVETIPSLNALDKSIKVLQEADAHRLSYIRGRYNWDGSLIPITMDTTYPGWYLSKDYIPVKYNSIVTWNFGKYSSGGNSCCLIMYNSNKEFVSSFGANSEVGTRNITIPSDVVYIRISFYKTFNEQPNTVPVIVDGVKYFIDDISKFNNHDAILFPTVSEYGVIGDSYPEEVVEIEKYLNYKRTANFNRLYFLHVSDNHNGSFGNAQNFLDYCPAKFLVNTGDMVNDKFADGASKTIDLAIAPTKPVYLVLGNHDVSYASSNQAIYDYFFGNSETDGTINHHNSISSGVVAERTYYNVDFATEKVKCIMLDMNDGWSDAELSNLGPYIASLGKMSQTQINWFVTQLQDAITNGYHVCVFIHTLPYNVDMKERILNFCDVGSNTNLGVNSALTFLPNIIDAFTSGSSVSFDYNGNSYNFTFASAGHFIAWFCGHTHYDMGGWMESHTNQFMINVCQPFNNTGGGAYLGSYDEDKLGVHFNFYTIDTNVKSLSVYRVGQQRTIYATERKCYRINYK